jgi:hypothetical protein
VIVYNFTVSWLLIEPVIPFTATATPVNPSGLITHAFT